MSGVLRMPVQLAFSESKRYIIYTLTDPLDMNELQRVYQKEKEHRDSVDHTVHSIVDMSRVKGIPRNWLTAKSGPGLSHPRSGKMLFVGISPALKTLVSLILDIMRYRKMEFYNTYAEAEARMQELLREEAIAK
jgi:hypothetical protein